jgi:uncharacterized protein YbjT (DUF2867 family)
MSQDCLLPFVNQCTQQQKNNCSMTTKVLIVGATGQLGSLITKAFLEKPNVVVSAMVRKGSESKAESLKQKGVQLISGDLTESVEQLQKACHNVDVVVSAVIGTADTIVDGQIRLLHAAKQAGVKRFIPSDYSADYLKADVGDNDFFDDRKKVAEEIQRIGIGHSLILNGVFTETLFGPFLNLIGSKNHEVNYYGSADTILDTTTYEDTAKFVAEAALDPDQHNKKVSVAGSSLSLNQIAQIYEEVSGHKIKLNRKGSVSDLKQLVDTIKSKNPQNIYSYIPLQYQYVMYSGRCVLDNLQNNKYPNIHATTVGQWLEKKKNSL